MTKIERAKEYFDEAAVAFRRGENYDVAKNNLEKAIELNPNYANAYNNFTLLLKKHFKDYEKAEHYFNKAEILFNPRTVKRIIQIDLKNYNQFEKNLRLDFTYPKGHKKEGQPLEKICLIGHGTGKSSILELIKAHLSQNKASTPNANLKTVFIYHKSYDYETDISLLNFPPYKNS